MSDSYLEFKIKKEILIGVLSATFVLVLWAGIEISRWMYAYGEEIIVSGFYRRIDESYSVPITRTDWQLANEEKIKEPGTSYIVVHLRNGRW